MFLILQNVLRWFLSTVLGVQAIKWILSIILIGITFVMGAVIENLLPDWLDPQAALNSIPSDVYWFMWLVSADYGVPLVLSAYVIRFTIRRLPVVG